MAVSWGCQVAVICSSLLSPVFPWHVAKQLCEVMPMHSHSACLQGHALEMEPPMQALPLAWMQPRLWEELLRKPALRSSP